MRLSARPKLGIRGSRTKIKTKTMKLTKQGVRDLNPKAYNGRPTVSEGCSHLYGPTERLGTEHDVFDCFGGLEIHRVAVYGKRCLKCLDLFKF